MSATNNSRQQAKGQAPKTQVNTPGRQFASGRSAGGPKARQQTGTMPGSGPSAAFQQHQQQQLSGSAPRPIINAPTSLANLAQLSGITLLPIGNVNSNSTQQNLSYNLPPNVSIQASPNFVMTSQPNSGSKNNFNSATSNQQQQRPSGSQTSNFYTANGQKQPIYNLASIPSIQLLNQTSAITDAVHWRTNNVSGDTKSQFNVQVQSSKPSAKTNNRKTKAQSNNNINLISKSNDIQVMPVTEGLQMYADVSDMQPTQSGSSFDDILSQPSLESMSEEQCADIDGDMNNISLIKLMAILNNPALTITAVDPKNDPRSTQDSSTNITNDDQSTSAMVKLVDNQKLNSFGKLCQTNNDYYQSSSPMEPQASITNQNRVPQSAANLNMYHGEPLDCLPAPTTKRSAFLGNTGSRANTTNIKMSKESARFAQQALKSADLSINWPSSLNSEGSTSTGVSSASISWLNSSNSFASTTKNDSLDKLNDPLMLSTSVRNLMMQQLPTGSKNSTVSVQLLKHIADQTKDNNWTSNQSQKNDTILEPECILNVVPLNVQQLNQGAKRVESQKTVTISSLKEKSPREPLLTTRDRLFVPRASESTNKRIVSEPKFNLSAISIDHGEEREVHVSEQHFMLESMMSSGENSAQRSTMPEPDEIFINRSKRVMSKIDTMVERKKRRRFERISGRAAPKTNSLEEQCAESEEEWSNEEDMDFELDGFIRAQLPLDEVETNEKKNFLYCVGLVSRQQKNKLSLEQCEEKFKIFSPLALEETKEIPEDVRRFVDIMLKTGGTDIQLRTDSNIKRNDLPLIEGLNRNTSRMKMSYMNVLGLEKRSKRTTLYKVKPIEHLNVQIPTRPIDLNKTSKNVTLEKQLSVEPEEAELQSTTTNVRLVGNNFVLPAKITLTSCREALKPPSKNEYMKSLGLIAS